MPDEPKVDLKVLDEAVKKVLVYKPRQKPKPKSESSPGKSTASRPRP